MSPVTLSEGDRKADITPHMDIERIPRAADVFADRMLTIAIGSGHNGKLRGIAIKRLQTS
ncbi:hypothetical protein CUJ88_49335 (plasmid) [Paraburkholderia hospita]|nr:hypothetical protein CUJ88_49335 [Paraburkholderia hospita]